MIAKINKGSSLYGAVSYNHNKVVEGTARVIASNRMIYEMANNPDRVMQQTLLSFENYLLTNKRTEKPILHVSLNPDPNDRLTDTQFAHMAKDYMDKMNYGNQPYIVYIHEDIDRRHIHIVSVCVDETGKKIDSGYEHRRSMDVCRELEQKYDLKNITNIKNAENAPYLKKIDTEKGDIKRQIANTFKSVSSYHFQTFGEYNALLSCFNIEAKTIKGEHDGKPFNGIIYSAKDKNGDIVGTPLKSSLFGKSYGYEGLEKRMKRCIEDFKKGNITPKIRNQIAQAMKISTGKEQFTQKLKTAGIDVVFRQNEIGRIYGVTFIDHNEQAVFNGSRLGKEFSATIFNNLFNKEVSNSIPENISYTDKESAIEQSFGLFSFEQHGTDPEEEAFALRMRKKKKKKLGQKI